MRIKIMKCQTSINPALRQQIEEHVQMALGRFASRISEVIVRCAVGSLIGGVREIRCRMEVILDKRLSVEGSDVDLFSAVKNAAVKASRRVALAIGEEDAMATPVTRIS